MIASTELSVVVNAFDKENAFLGEVEALVQRDNIGYFDAIHHVMQLHNSDPEQIAALIRQKEHKAFKAKLTDEAKRLRLLRK